ncbi:hypothetical protein QQF64_017566, partial [Cirrhinus molitorella]
MSPPLFLQSTLLKKCRFSHPVSAFCTSPFAQKRNRAFISILPFPTYSARLLHPHGEADADLFLLSELSNQELHRCRAPSSFTVNSTELQKRKSTASPAESTHRLCAKLLVKFLTAYTGATQQNEPLLTHICLSEQRFINCHLCDWTQLPLHCHHASFAPSAGGDASHSSPGNCSGEDSCSEGVVLPVWNPQNPSVGDKVARAIVYFVALIYMFLGMSIIADRFMSSIEVITSQEKEITIKKPNGETTTATVRIWNETVSNLTLMALGSSAPEILLSVIEVCGHKFEAGHLGPSTIVGSAAFNMFIIIAICVYVVPDGEVRKIKHLRVFFVTAAWSVFAYIWLYLILSVFSPGVVEVWEAVLTFLFFPLCVVQAWIADRRLLFYKYVHKRYRADKNRGIIIETEGDGMFTKMDMEMDGQGANSHHKEALDGMLAGVEEGGGGGGGGEEEEARREMARTLKELKQRHPEKDMEQLIEMANYQVLVQQQKSRAFYRIQATRMMIGAGNILKKHAADQARKVVSCHEANAQEEDPHTIYLEFEPSHYQCFENCGSLKLSVTRHGGDSGCTVKVDYRTEDGTANAGSDYEFAEGTLVFKPGETVKELTVGVIDDDIFEEDEHFYVHLSNPRVVHRAEVSVLDPNAVSPGNSIIGSSHVPPKAALGNAHTATVTIYDDDHAGIFTFESNSTRVSESVGIMQVKVHRTSGARGKVAVPFHTTEGTAKAGEDYEEVAGKLEFLNDET